MYGTKIKAIRMARGMTQDELAAKIHVAPNTYCKMEQDQRKNWDEDLLQKIAAALDVTISDIVSPTPIIMSFHDSPNSVVGNQTITISKEVLDILQKQLEQKDAMIMELLKKISG